MKRHIGMRRQPVVVFLVSGRIVQNHMNLPVRRIVGHNLVHEGLEVLPLLGLGDFPPDRSGGHFQGREEIDGPMALVGTLHPPDNFPARGLDVTGLPLDLLNRRLFIHGQDQRVVRRNTGPRCPPPFS